MQKTFHNSLKHMFDTCKKVLEQLGMEIKYENFDECLIVASTGTSLRSWGETIEIKFHEKDTQNTEVHVKSSAQAQLFSWGQNSRNEEEIIDSLLATSGK
jgi:hypothetical protein